MYWDFQGRNILIRNGDPYFIDFQDGRRGPLHYDVASLLNQAKAEIPDSIRASLLDGYLAALSAEISVDREQFARLYRAISLIRILRNFGTSGLRGLHERKVYFVQAIRQAAHAVSHLLKTEGLPCALPHLQSILLEIISRFATTEANTVNRGLTVLVSSFSYKQGVPVDDSAHGGGFVFDCRSLPNPGKDPAMREKTGRDPAIITYLESLQEATNFWSHTSALVDAAVDRYTARGFDHLFVAFGCTGGRHRSVFFAEKLRRHLAKRDGVTVIGGHRALGSNFE